MIKKLRWIFMGAFVLIAISITYFFLFTPFYNKYCERRANKYVIENRIAFDKAEKVFFERNKAGWYKDELCTGHEYEGIFQSLGSNNFKTKEIKTPNCKTEFEITNKIADGLYPKRDIRKQTEIATECKISI